MYDYARKPGDQFWEMEEIKLYSLRDNTEISLPAQNQLPVEMMTVEILHR